MYIKQKLQVKWNNQKSHKFSVTNGVRQEGVLSPFLFSVYMDELLVTLKNNGVGRGGAVLKYTHVWVLKPFQAKHYTPPPLFDLSVF